MKQALSQIHAEEMLKRLRSERDRQFLREVFSGAYTRRQLQERHGLQSVHAVSCLRSRLLYNLRHGRRYRQAAYGTNGLTDRIRIVYALRLIGCTLRFAAASLGIHPGQAGYRMTAAYRAGLPRIPHSQRPRGVK